jgi:hypothetical protein
MDSDHSDVIFLEKAMDFLDRLDVKTRKKIYDSINCLPFGIVQTNHKALWSLRMKW